MAQTTRNSDSVAGTAAAISSSRPRPSRLLLVFVLLLLGLAVGVALLWYGLSPSGPTLSPAAQAALAYSRGGMQWYSGPQVRSARVVPLRLLPQVLANAVPSQVRSHVNVPALLRRYGPDRRIALVVLYGAYNSLPPDEGVEVRGEVVALVDPKSDRVLLLMD